MLEVVPFENGNQPVMIALAVVFTVLPTCVVGLRIWARKISKKRLQWSDFWILTNNAVLVAYWTLCILCIVSGGLGKKGHLITHKPMLQSEIVICRGSQIIDILFGFATFFLKLSTLSLLRELFCTNRKAKLVQSILTYITVVSSTVAITSTLVLDFPLDYSCDVTAQPTKVDRQRTVYDTFYNYASTLILDIAILAVPIWQLYPLKLNHRKKVGIMITFGLGFGRASWTDALP
ncbi:hypothetical protein PG991_011640 [Apiospora marii]|uniref:Rhodopsin domain-containing protein n=2 Tax=Apiospora marii TaxID=335849 RepID=A0ABR1RES8_9PEZI